MATTIKVDNTLAGWTWQDDQLLDPAADVDYFVKATNAAGTYVPQSQVGKGVDTVSGVFKVDTVKA